MQAVLEQEVEALRAVLATLAAERAALDSRDAEALFSASSAKGAAVTHAARLEQERSVSAGSSSSNDEALHAELKRLATECRRQNDANGLLIRGQRRRVEGSLRVLKGTASAPDTYGRDGESLPVRNSRTPLASY